MEVDGPFGTRIRLYGKQMSCVALFFAVAAGGWYMADKHDTNAAAANEASLKAIGVVQSNQQKLAEHMDEMIYVMSLSERDREKLNIAMPNSLRSKLR